MFVEKIITPNAVDIYMSKPDIDGYTIGRYNTLKEEFIDYMDLFTAFTIT